MKARNILLTTALAGVALGFVQKAQPTLKDAFKKDFYVGAALNYRQLNGQDAKATALIKQQFNTISPENLLKWGPVHPQLNTYNFKPADDYVAFGQQNNMFIIGHTLMWHQQTPKWVFEDEAGKPVSREVLLKRLEEHINTVVGRYKGKIGGWDVLNEAIDDQQGDLRKTKWLEILGEDFAAKAFEYAHKADPKAELYYNDYSLFRPEKREGVIKLVKSLQAKGVKVTAIGMQGHYGLKQPSIEQIEASIVAFSKLGVHVNFTELDVDVLPKPSRRQGGADISENYAAATQYNPYQAGLPDSVQQQLTNRYADLFALFHKHRDVIDRITLWGVTDADSWLNDWPIRGRTSYPLLFGRNYEAKPAFQSVVQAAAQKSK
ncbi:endo-1,4-beta-xylanase [Hymenobacter taeanensis]|uniref:Beta-xylanase n=1 Tax=Hymenobacter taeanensis TaxID=2735321 RepID=A0A6M6BM83_9BACT|nr:MULTISPECIES: endo-1,4-beta-xylanase [Hymenobacter]QJX48938.1 endo-1,4-beta-xylanase [Hymenobacter taeanensis]UOQ81547.1 endo-1,4-beta-xylanase [Hymenobacter sp. 5414T-23]